MCPIIMKKLKVHDWEFWQTYRKDRGTPPWIKVHRCLLSDAKWASLGDHEKGHLVSMWLLAADRDGIIPNDAKLIKKLCMLDNEPDINKFIMLGLIEPDGCHDDATMTPTCAPVDAPETETETETETEICDFPKNEKLKKGKKFAPPSLQEVKKYCFERENGIDAERFINFYESKGWMIGKNKMKCWKSAVRTWEKNEVLRGKNGNQLSRAGMETARNAAEWVKESKNAGK